eukprot:1146490-Pelagomonas_calceolata.AAC.2
MVQLCRLQLLLRPCVSTVAALVLCKVPACCITHGVSRRTKERKKWVWHCEEDLKVVLRQSITTPYVHVNQTCSPRAFALMIIPPATLWRSGRWKLDVVQQKKSFEWRVSVAHFMQCRGSRNSNLGMLYSITGLEALQEGALQGNPLAATLVLHHPTLENFTNLSMQMS